MVKLKLVQSEGEAMTRRRYVYRKNDETGEVECFEVGEEYRPPERAPVFGESHYDGLRATDGTPINTKRKHRDYMKANNLTMADDFKETWAKAQKKREQAFTTGTPENRKEIRETLERTLYEKWK